MTTATVTNLHKWHHSDYEDAKRDIHTMLGDISREEVFGRYILVAVYVRPEKTAGGTWMTAKQQKEDVFQGKAVLLLACGPDAFSGDESYLKAMFGNAKPPAVGDWLLTRASDGTAISVMGENASRIKVPTVGGKMVDKYDWDGWPCRILRDDDIIGRMAMPHEIV